MPPPALHTFPFKDPDETLDYTFDLATSPVASSGRTIAADAALRLLTGEAIQTAVWSVSPAGPTLVTQVLIDNGGGANTAARVWVSGGVDGVEYALSVVVTTDSAPPNDRVIERTFCLPVREL